MNDIGPHRIRNHELLGPLDADSIVSVTIDGALLHGIEGESISALLIAHGVKLSRTMPGSAAPRTYFCGVGRCADCAVIVDDELNVRACVTPIREGMIVRTQRGLGSWDASE